jgi:RNA-directed DNA polymerase
VKGKPDTNSRRKGNSPESEEGYPDGRSTRSTEEAGPMKRWQQRGGENPVTKGKNLDETERKVSWKGGGRKVMKTMIERPNTFMSRGTRETNGDGRIRQDGYRGPERPGVNSHPVPAQTRAQEGSNSINGSLGERGTKEERVMERVYEPERLRTAWRQIRSNAGAAGIDGVTVKAFEAQEGRYLKLVNQKLGMGHYRFKPARRVLIEKPGSDKKRPLGIPVVMDRVVSQSVAMVLEGIFDKEFTASNFGYRRGKSQHQAVRYMKETIDQGYLWSVSLDLKSFFDEIPHGLILKLIRRRIYDEKLVTLIARALKAGVIIDGMFMKTEKGSPQGSPLSPMLSNIVLNEVDHEIERRGHKYVRWADDMIIFVKSQRAAYRVMETMIRYIEQMGLPVNREKSRVESSDKATFCGLRVRRGKISMSKKSVKTFKIHVRERTKRENGQPMKAVVEDLNEYLRGWIGYFQIQEHRKPLKELDMFIRNRLRSMQLKKWKNPVKFRRMMRRMGRPEEEVSRTWVQMDKWSSVKRQAVRFTLNNVWFRRLRVVFLEDFVNRNLEFKFSH